MKNLKWDLHLSNKYKTPQRNRSSTTEEVGDQCHVNNLWFLINFNFDNIDANLLKIKVYKQLRISFLFETDSIYRIALIF